MVTTPTIPIPLVVAAIQENAPRSILDIGCGFGRYGFLFREALDVQFSDKSSFSRENWVTKIDAVEVYPQYITELQRHIYNQVFIGDIIDVIEKDILGRYDVVFMADVIEHLTKERGYQLLDWAYARAEKMVAITTPSFDLRNPDADEYDRHKSAWSPQDFRAFPHKKVVRLENRVLCVFLIKEGADFFLPMFGRSPLLQSLSRAGHSLLKKSPLGEKVWNLARRLKERWTYKEL